MKRTIKNKRRHTQRGRGEMMNYFNNPSLTNAYGNTALHNAAYNGDINEIQRLLASGANINAVNNKGETALHIALINGNIDMAKVLLSNGASKTIRDKMGRNASWYLNMMREENPEMNLNNGRVNGNGNKNRRSLANKFKGFFTKKNKRVVSNRVNNSTKNKRRMNLLMQYKH